MSLVEIVHHNEVIYTILDKPPPEPPKTPRYESQLEKELKQRKIPQLCLTFGYAETPVTKPENFLKKGCGMSQPIKTPQHKCSPSGNLPPVPKRPPPQKKTEKPVVNFRVVNIRKAIKSKAKPPQPRFVTFCSQMKIKTDLIGFLLKDWPSDFEAIMPEANIKFGVSLDKLLKYGKRLVDTRDGHIKRIKGSGEVPEYCLRPDFGKMPAYLVNRNRRIQKCLDKIRHAEETKESLCKLIDQEERLKLLDDLKQKWQVMQKAFLQLPILTDTPPKIMKKAKMENDLRQLEKDIAVVESNPYIYIY